MRREIRCADGGTAGLKSSSGHADGKGTWLARRSAGIREGGARRADLSMRVASRLPWVPFPQRHRVVARLERPLHRRYLRRVPRALSCRAPALPPEAHPAGDTLRGIHRGGLTLSWTGGLGPPNCHGGLDRAPKPPTLVTLPGDPGRSSVLRGVWGAPTPRDEMLPAFPSKPPNARHAPGHPGRSAVLRVLSGPRSRPGRRRPTRAGCSTSLPRSCSSRPRAPGTSSTRRGPSWLAGSSPTRP